MCDLQISTCYLCGEREATTRDHLFPRLLFAKGKAPSDSITLPACSKCNNDLSKDEELFQQLVLSGRALDTHAARDVWESKVRPNLNNRKRRARQRVLHQMEIVEAVTLHGQRFAHWPVLKIDPEVIQRVLEKFAKGLYFLEQGKTLPDCVKIEFVFAPDNYERLIIPELLSDARKQEVSEDVLTYWRAVASDNPTASITWFAFYRWNLFCVFTVPPELG